MMNNSGKYLIWTLLSVIGAFALGYIALNRGEQINALWIVVAAVCVYLIAYRFYGLYIAKNVLAVDPTRMTPAVRHNDGLDYVPTDKKVLFGHHFAAIAGAGPLVGPVLAAQMGYLPGMIWILAGVVLAGAVQDFMVLFVSTRRDGRSLGELVKEEMGPTAGVLALVACFMIMVIILAVLAMIVVKALTHSPWGTYTVAFTIPLAIFMGIYIRYLRPGRIGEVSVIGLVMLVLIGVAPAGFVVNMNASGYEITRTRDAVNNVETFFQQRPELLKKATGAEQLIPSPDAGAAANGEFHCHPANTINALDRVKTMLTGTESYDTLSVEQRSHLRRIMLCISDTTDKVAKLPEVNADDKRLLKKLKTDMLSTIEYAPIWIIMAVALALGIGTMIGWRRVATTIGEKIGKKGMTYAQGMSAQMTAAVSIGLASYTGMPVSTTHVLSSSVAGTMLVDGGGLQKKTVTSILMAWVLTLPAAILLSGALYWLSLQII